MRFRFRPVVPTAALVLCAIVGFTCAAAAPIDCESMQRACNVKCGQVQIYNNGSETYLKSSDFKPRCEKACSAGFSSCNLQDSANACDTFFNRCIAACPWKVIDTYADVTVVNTNSFQQCGQACASAHLECKSLKGRVPPRPRTGKFDACEEAQGACYPYCMRALPKDANRGSSMDDPEFPDKCAAACAKGVPACKAASAPKKCASFLEQCKAVCPRVSDADTARYHAELGAEFDEFSTGSLCGDACSEGMEYCEAILK